ncbi:MAG: HDOD domain-containing protein [Chloroflexi bacterium CFX7]|nr:HDOD domain-containing protein [Chloroflexi bacterium CFX7]MCK6563569.1 HDOD domain-containing protein [Dehalococcoidia bacterium]MCL4232548.1 HDOD domain-containing protein [Dehalococcoidia bacterium]RIL02989.1 MAG: hypothetical protein DCC78_05980 [bacterium]
MSSNARDILGQLEDLPPLPAVAARVMGLADDDRTSALDLAQVLSTDQALTARLIKISNSAYYGFARRVGTVREAVLVLGFKQVRQLAVGASLVNSFKRNRLLDGVFDLDLFWGHSVATAVAGEAIAKKTRAARPEDAFTAGILHDIGRLVISQVMPREFADAVTFARSNHSSLHEAETRLTGFDHAAVGRVLGEQWKFPGHLVDAIALHHDEAQTPAADGLPGVVAQANRLVLHYGLYCGYDDEQAAPGEMPGDLAAIEEAAGGIERVLERAFAFIESASGTPERWYAAAG